ARPRSTGPWGNLLAAAPGTDNETAVASSRRGVRAGAGWRSTEGQRSSLWYLLTSKAVNRQPETAQRAADLPDDGPHRHRQEKPGHPGHLTPAQDQEHDGQGVEAHGPAQEPGGDEARLQLVDGQHPHQGPP